MGKDFLDFVDLPQNQILTLRPITFHSSKVFSEEKIKMEMLLSNIFKIKIEPGLYPLPFRVGVYRPESN